MLKNQALKYVEAGFSIIPLKPRSKLPLIKWARFQKRKATKEEITKWWTRWPDANIALLTGKINNIIVFDEDGPEAEKIIKEKGGFPPGPQSVTAKGRHYIFRHPGFSIGNDVNKKLDLDIRGDGGYIVAPPSVHPSGHVYSWAPELSLFEIEIAEMRDWQIEYLKENCIVGSKSPRNVPGWHQESLKGVSKGQRNDTAAKLAGRYITKGLSDSETASILLPWNRKNRPPLPEVEIRNIIKSIRQKDSKKSKKEAISEERSLFDSATISPEVLEKARAADFFEGKRFVPQFLAKYLQAKFDPIIYGTGQFYQYKPSGVWKVVEPDLLGQEAEKVMDKATKSARIEDAIKTLQKRVFMRGERFEHNPEFLNLKNGMLETTTITLKKHDPAYLSRIQLDVKLDKKAQCPRWNQFLEEIFPEAPEKAKMLQCYFGYCLLPHCGYQRCLFLLGSGANGKSVVTDVLISILGKDNVCSLPLQLMGQRFLIGQLKDKLVNVAGEIATNQPTDTSVFKAAVVGSLLIADEKHGKPFSFSPVCKHVFSMNEAPKITDKSYGFQRRPIVLTFSERFEGDRRDPHLTKKLIREKDGIFLWMLEGLKMVLEKDDLYMPEAVERATKEFIKATNPVLLFVDDCCILGTEYWVKPKDLYKEYLTWCKEGGNRPLSRNRFYDQILIHFPSVQKKRSGEEKSRVYYGIGLQQGQEF
jgi:putative DNA primase/helicase